MASHTGAVGAHLVGSVPLAGEDEVFRLASEFLKPRLRRIPDGETGARSDWIVWQMPVLQSSAQLETVPPDPEHYRPLPRVQLRPGADASEAALGPLGYASAAIASYRTFTAMRSEGTVAPHCRFQVSLPTPLAPIGAFVMPRDQAALEPVYETRLLEELDEILAAIPHRDLAVQWDTAVEFGLLEGVFPAWFGDIQDSIVQRLVRIGDRVPGDVELGYHLCYGDAGHKHFTQPSDAGLLVAVANGLCAGLSRPPEWVHMPVPRDRDDDGYFRPLQGLRLPAETELYLGLVHMTDGLEGSKRRAEAARRSVGSFGVATECGFGRRPPETIPDLLKLHAKLCAALD